MSDSRLTSLVSSATFHMVTSHVLGSIAGNAQTGAGTTAGVVPGWASLTLGWNAWDQVAVDLQIINPANPPQTINQTRPEANFWIDTRSSGTAAPPDELRIYDAYIDVTYMDGSTQRIRPISYEIIAGIGSVLNPANAMDENAGTYASIQRSDFTTSSMGTQFVLKFWNTDVGPLQTACGNPPGAFSDQAYSHTVPATGGSGPYTFAITNGSLPPGLTLNPNTGVISGTPPTLLNILHLDATTHNDEGSPIDGFWESGLVRGKAEWAARMIRVGALDMWLRGNGTPEITVYGPDKQRSFAAALLSASGVPATLSEEPGIMYQSKVDLSKVENYTVRFRTNAVDEWFELSGFCGYSKQDLFNR